MPSCNNHLRNNDNEQRKNSINYDYRRRFKKEMGRDVYCGHHLHHIFPKSLQPAFDALGIDIHAPENLVEIPARTYFTDEKTTIKQEAKLKDNSINIHLVYLHGKDETDNDTITAFMSDFFDKHNFIEESGLNVQKLTDLSEEDRQKFSDLVRDFAVDFLKSRTEGIDLGNGIRVVDCIGGAPYYDK